MEDVTGIYWVDDWDDSKHLIMHETEQRIMFYKILVQLRLRIPDLESVNAHFVLLLMS